MDRWSSFDRDEEMWDLCEDWKFERPHFWFKYMGVDLDAERERHDFRLKYMNIDNKQELVNDDKPEYEEIYDDEDDCNDESYPDGQELVNNDEHEYEEVHDDHDYDSNDENNWRNDYPAEDPRFFENDDAAIYYSDVDGYDLSSDEDVYSSELPYYSYYRLVRQWTEEYHSTTEDEEDMTEESHSTTEDEEDMTEESHSTTEDEEDMTEESHSTTEDEEDEDAK